MKASMVWFVAVVGAAEEVEDINTFAVVLAEKHDGSGMRLEIQKALSFEGGDASAGMDTYCLCIHTGATHYGGVVSSDVKDGRLSMTLDDDAASELGVERYLAIELRMGDQMIKTVVDGLNRVLESSV